MTMIYVIYRSFCTLDCWYLLLWESFFLYSELLKKVCLLMTEIESRFFKEAEYRAVPTTCDTMLE